MPLNPVKYQYRPRPPVARLLTITKYDLDSIDSFLKLAQQAQLSERADLEVRAAIAPADTPDDFYADDFAELGDFWTLGTEFAIVGLWRCIELYRKRAIRAASGEKAAAEAFRHKEFQEELSKLGITETRIRCAHSVDELRCLSNAVKHAQSVDSDLAKFSRWQGKKGRKLGNLERHYRRRRPLAERYLTDLTNRLTRSTAAHNP